MGKQGIENKNIWVFLPCFKIRFSLERLQTLFSLSHGEMGPWVLWNTSYLSLYFTAAPGGNAPAGTVLEESAEWLVAEPEVELLVLDDVVLLAAAISHRTTLFVAEFCLSVNLTTKSRLITGITFTPSGDVIGVGRGVAGETFIAALSGDK